MNGAQISWDANTLVLAGRLTFTTVARLWEQIKPLLVRNKNSLCVDLKNVEDSDSAGVVLLIALLRTARQQNKSLHFAHLPEQMRAIIHVANLEKIINEG